MAWKQLPTTSRSTLDLWRMDDHAYAPGSTTVGHMFGIAEALTVVGAFDRVPAELEYRPGPLLDRESVEEAWPDAEYLARLDDGSLSEEEATRALRVLHRYLRFVRMVHGEEE